jgi:hypothetical protein
MTISPYLIKEWAFRKEDEDRRISTGECQRDHGGGSNFL